MNAIAQVVVEPAHVPCAQIVRTHAPPGAVAPIEDCEVAFQPPVLSQHRRESCVPWAGPRRRQQAVEPGLGVWPSDLISRKSGDVEKTNILPNIAAFSSNDLLHVGALECQVLFKVLGWCKVKWHFQVPRDPPTATSGTHRIMRRRHLKRSSGGKLFIRVRHHETARVKLAGRFLDILLVFSIFTITCNIHRPGIGFRLAMDHPLGERLTDATALQEASHDRACRPVSTFAGYRSDQRITVW